MSRCISYAIPVVLTACIACGGASDPREIDGAIRYMAAAVDINSSEKLFRVVDARSRHALASIVQDRQTAASAICEYYPEAERERALSALGDAGRVSDAAGLFVARCDTACLQAVGTQLAASETVEGDELDVLVHTARGTTLRLHRLGPGGWWGLVWHLEELDAERSRAAEERRAIQANAEVYDRSRRQEQAAAP